MGKTIKLTPLKPPDPPKFKRPSAPFKLEYVITNAEKRPLHDYVGVECYTFEDVENEDNLALKVPTPFSNFDFDNEDEAEIMLEIIEGLDLKCRVLKTDRGIHCYFRTPDGTGSPTKRRNALGLTQDIKGWDANGLAMVKRNGVWREWIRDIPWEDIEVAPIWLKIIHGSKYKDLYDFPNLTEGGRNGALHPYIGVLQTRGFTQEQIIETIHLINDYVLQDPLPQEEMETILRDDSFFESVQQAVVDEFFYNKKFLHERFGEHLMEGLKVVTFHGIVYTYRDGYYQSRERMIEREMTDLYRGCTRRQKGEVLDYVKLRTTVDPEDIRLYPDIINVRNGRVNLRTGELLPHTPDVIEFAQLPVYYDPLAPDHELLEQTLLNVFCGDKELFDLFEEMVGYLLTKHAYYHKAFVLFGSGRNGKSTILDVLKTFTGEVNYSSVELAALNDKFKTAELEHKLANIGDDIGKGAIRDTAVLKKLISGDSITVERKNQQPFTLNNYAKLLFATNGIPHVNDTSFGMEERLILIPFEARFTKSDPNYDPKIKEKLTTPEALTHLFNMGLRGYRRLTYNKGFTKPKAVDKLMEEYRADLTPIRRWVNDEDVTRECVVGQPTARLFSDYKDWVQRTGENEKETLITFNRELKTLLEVDVKTIRFEDGTVKGFC